MIHSMAVLGIMVSPGPLTFFSVNVPKPPDAWNLRSTCTGRGGLSADRRVSGISHSFHFRTPAKSMRARTEISLSGKKRTARRLTPGRGEISVSPEDDVELRRVTLINHSHSRRVIELTSYAEVVLALPAADASHPAFSNLFVQTEFLSPRPAILCTRRPRSEGEKPPWLLNFMVGQGGEQGEVSCETDRARFIGRGRTLAAPAALQTILPLSNTTGSVLDPISSLRQVERKSTRLNSSH